MRLIPNVYSVHYERSSNDDFLSVSSKSTRILNVPTVDHMGQLRINYVASRTPVPPVVWEPKAGRSRGSAAEPCRGPNGPAAQCGGRRPEEDKLALSWRERLRPWSVPSDAPGSRVKVRLCGGVTVPRRVETLRHTTHVSESVHRLLETKALVSSSLVV